MTQPVSITTGQMTVREGSLADVAYLIHLALGIRYFALYIGIAFALWEGSAVALRFRPLDAGVVIQYSPFSVLCPALMWIEARWVEQVARNVVTSNSNLIAANRVSQQALAEWQLAEAVRIRSEDRFRDLVETAATSFGRSTTASATPTAAPISPR